MDKNPDSSGNRSSWIRIGIQSRRDFFIVRLAAKRRAWAKRVEEKMEEERKAFWPANVRGRGIGRGQFIVT